MEKEKMAAFEQQSYNRPGVFPASCLGILMLLFTIYIFAFSEKTEIPENELKSVVDEYYHAMNFNKIETLPKFLSPNIREWYGNRNLTLSEVMKNARIQRTRYPFVYSEIDWTSFQIKLHKNNEYFVSYNMIHRAKRNLNDPYQVFHLHIKTYWDQNLKLKAITETSSENRAPVHK